MYLLIPNNDSSGALSVIFTFHNVSINSIRTLLKIWIKKVFTFHNVSINSSAEEVQEAVDYHLHSIMYLLILEASVHFVTPDFNLHSIMYLLIHLYALFLFCFFFLFTFHNVSINSGKSF